MLLEIFNALLRKKMRVIRLFRIFWLVICLAIFLSVRAQVSGDADAYLFWYSVALLSGKTSLVTFAVTLSPGIFNRFKVRNRILGLLMIFRRQLGITMFLLALFHGLTVSLLPRLLQGTVLNLALFEFFGLSSAVLLLPLFITSNDFSQAKLGKSWWLLHRLVYVIMWLLMFHVALQRLSVWSVLAVLLVTAEVTAILYSNFRLYSGSRGRRPAY